MLEWDSYRMKELCKKIAEQISAIAFQAPHALHMDKEFALLQEAAHSGISSGIPEPGTFSEKISMLNILTYKNHTGKAGTIF